MLRVFIVMLFLPAAAAAQGAGFSLSGGGIDTDAPVEITADSLSLDQSSGSAVFDGNVLVVQGDLRLSAGRIEVAYGTEGGGIERLIATGGVTLVTPDEAAEAASATYDVAGGRVVMEGDVLLTQGAASIAGDRLVFDIEAGTGRVEGRVRTVFGGSR